LFNYLQINGINIRMGTTISNLVFQPPPLSYANAKKHLKWLKTKSSASIPAFYIDRKSPITMLFSHGNAEDIGMIYEWFCEFSREINVNFLAYDYEGYGKASGSPSEKACYDDIDAVYDYLTLTLRQKPENIVLYGRSLGSGPSCYLAERLSNEGIRLGGLILQV
jgi:pimeloyl-ACP methyl ester carboxylesterase